MEDLGEISQWLVLYRYRLSLARLGEEADLARMVTRLAGRYRARRAELA